jgi:anti-sigma factor RsiW
MNTATHPVAPEEVMAFLDGELSSSEAQAVSSHLDQCAECAGLAAQFRSTSQSLSGWTVPPVSSSLFESVEELSAKAAASLELAKPGRTVQLSFWNWRLWAVGGAVATLLLVVGLSKSFRTRREMVFLAPGTPMAARPQATRQPSDAEGYFDYSPAEPKGMDGLVAQSAPAPSAPVAKAVSGIAGSADARAFSAAAPMIARTVSLSIAVKDFAAARASLDSILLRHRGYAAQLNAATAENAPRTLQASLRIPAPELATALAELKGLGRVESETQSGDEVTQQHTDLAARIQNSRETEERLRAILEQRTGKIEDVLQVEEEIARVRGEIESMEAEQQALEHRVDFASVDLQLAEEYKAALNPPSASVSNRIHNAFVGGLRSAAEMLLGFVLFVEESGPVLLIWLAILGVPVLLLWRRYRRVKARL